MSMYVAAARTNYFRVTDEEKYTQLFLGLCSGDRIVDFSEKRDEIIYHGFGAYDSIDYVVDEEYEEYDFDVFLEELQKILPEDEVFIYIESGYEKLRYVSGFAIVVTSKEIKSVNLENWAREQAKQLLGNDFDTETTY